jgi:glutathione S-transferase
VDEAAQAAMKLKSTGDYSKLIERIQAKLSAAQPFLGGSSPNLLDAYALVLYRWGGMTGINPATIPAYRDYVERLAKHPAMAAAIERERIPLQTFKPA